MAEERGESFDPFVAENSYQAACIRPRRSDADRIVRYIPFSFFYNTTQSYPFHISSKRHQQGHVSRAAQSPLTSHPRTRSSTRQSTMTVAAVFIRDLSSNKCPPQTLVSETQIDPDCHRTFLHYGPSDPLRRIQVQAWYDGRAETQGA